MTGDADRSFEEGIVQLQKGERAEAEALFREAINACPSHTASRFALATLLASVGRFQESEIQFRKLFDSDPHHHQALNNLGCLLEQQGKLDEAAFFFRKSVAACAEYPDARLNLAQLLHRCGRESEAEILYRDSIRLRPDYRDAHFGLGLLLKNQRRFHQAEQAYRAALNADSQYAPALTNLGIVLRIMGRLHEALECYRAAIAAEPGNVQAWQNMLFLLAYLPDLDSRKCFEDHCAFGRRFGCVSPASADIVTRADAEPLRVGFVSGDFRDHPVYHLFAPVLASHDRRQVEMICYSNVPFPDAATEKLRNLTDGWRDISRMGDEEAAVMIRSDRIDILVDLSGHTAGNRLLLFCRKPAPVQVEWLGYWNTSGICEMDFIISDEVTTPEAADQQFVEQVVRLPDTRFCWGGIPSAPPPAPPPCQETGFVTFGCFNNLTKINDGVVNLWSKILLAIPESRLILKSVAFDDPDCRETLLHTFTSCGITQDRLTLLPASGHNEMLRQYSLVDIALDTFPFPGGMTTMEALWMGVPVVAMSGESMIGRQSDSILSVTGLGRLVAADGDSYVKIATALAGDRNGLAAMRPSLRQQMESSLLMDAKRFTRNLEEAFHAMWRHRSESQRRAAEERDALYRFASMLLEKGMVADAKEQLTALLRDGCVHASAHADLGMIYLNENKLEPALLHLKEAIRIDAGHATAHYGLAMALAATGDDSQAEFHFREALKLHPVFPQALNNLGVMIANGKPAEALECYRLALRQRPGYTDAAVNLALLLRRQLLLSEAHAVLADTQLLAPDDPKLLSALGAISFAMGDPAQAAERWKMASELDPSLTAAKVNRLYALHYLEEVTPQQLLDEHRSLFRSTKIAAVPSGIIQHPRIRLGYVSGDFRQHSVAYFLEPVLENHDHNKFEIFCYSNVTAPDSVTERFVNLSDHWRDISHLSDNQAEQIIRADGIDILVDLSGQTSGNRLFLFAARPAPVQVTWLGYPGTTGLKAIDYRITDNCADPPGTDQEYCEQLVRLPGAFLCYSPPVDSPPVTDRGPGKGVVFGSFNNIAKVSDATIAVWSEILRSVPDSRLFLKSKPLIDPGVRASIQERFNRFGINADRLRLAGWAGSPADHLTLYSEIDIALDPFPYNGTTTTLEALWMGVPVVTLSGRRHATRVGETIMRSLGLAELVADAAQQYLEVAMKLAGDEKLRSGLRSTLRQRLANSHLLDGAAFAKRLEEAYEGMWQKWQSKVQREK